MNAGPDVTRLIADWLVEEAPTRAPDRVLLTTAVRLDTTRQRIHWIPWRFPTMNTPLRVGMAAVIGMLLLGAGIYLFGGSGSGIGGQPATAAPTPTLLASGSFNTHGAAVELDATGGGSSVTGVMTLSDEGGGFTVDLECARTTDGGLIVIGGDVTESTNSFAPEGTRVAIILQRASPVRAYPHFEPDPPATTCLAFLEGVTDSGSAAFLEPIEGDVELGQ